MFVFTAALWTSGLIPEIMPNIQNPTPKFDVVREFGWSNPEEPNPLFEGLGGISVGSIL
jgi:hypothetical protein